MFCGGNDRSRVWRAGFKLLQVRVIIHRTTILRYDRVLEVKSHGTTEDDE